MSTPRIARGRLAAVQRHHGDKPERVEAAQRALKAANAEQYIRRIVDAAPPLTDQQRAQLAALLAPVSEREAA